MAKKVSIEFEYDFFNSLEDLKATERKLVIASRKIAKKAYAPYSNFFVGAAVLLENGEIILGNNQENVAFSDGNCAERAAVSYAKANFPNQAIEMIAITGSGKNFEMEKPISPCGSCRQVLAEYEQVQGKPIKVILASNYDEVYRIEGAMQLLPLLFFEKNLSKD